LLEEMDLELMREEDPHSDIELSSHEEERALEVLLDDEGAGADGELGAGVSDPEGFFD
jgi:hypothetical protein